MARAQALLLLALLTGCGAPDPDRQPVPPPPPEEVVPVTVAELQSRAKAACPDLFLPKLHPLLPTAWPPTGAVRALLYTSKPLPTGRHRYAVTTASRQVTLPLEGDGSDVVTLEAKPLGEVGRLPDPLRDQLGAAEEALVAVVAGARQAEDARGDLQGYLAWLESQPPFEAEVTAHAPQFLAWLREPGGE